MAIEAIQSNQITGTTRATGGAELGAQQFLNLLITQMQYQNPFSPMDNQAFMNQLTQFASLEELQTINSQLQTNMVYTQSLNNTLLLGLIGRQATVPGQRVTVAAGSATQNQIDTASGGVATVTVRNAAGQVVATYTRQVSAGWNDISWDGRTSDGTAAADGTYTLDVALVDRAGQALTHTDYMTAPVESIRFENNMAIVRIAGEDFYVAEIRQISR